MSEVKLCLEDLSNEIFDYLYGQQIFISFFNLNHRFNLFCNYYLKCYIDTTDPSFTRNTTNRLRDPILSKHIRSLKFSDEKWLSRFSIRYFCSLHSFTFINAANPTKIKEFLEKLPSPDQLYHLFINFNLFDTYDIQDLLRTTFKLSDLVQLRLDVSLRENTLGFVKIDQPLLSLRHFSSNRIGLNYFLKLVPFMPNLISLNLADTMYESPNDLKFIPTNSLSKLKTLELRNIQTDREIRVIFQLCPQVKTFKMHEYRKTFYGNLVCNAKYWEKLLSPLKFLTKIEINIHGLCKEDFIDLSEYDTVFWIQKNFKAGVYFDEIYIVQGVFTSNNPNAFLSLNVSRLIKNTLSACKITDVELMDLTGYKTEVWTQRHLTAI